MVKCLVSLLAVLLFVAPSRGEITVTQQETRITVDLRDGSHLVGSVAIEKITVNSAFGKVAVPLKQISQMALAEKGDTVTLHMMNGDKVTGSLELDAVTMNAAWGKIRIGTSLVRELRVLADPSAGGLRPVLWNKLESREGVRQSEIGPGVTIVGDGLEFVPGKFGNGITSADDHSGLNFGPWEKINPEYHRAGTVEFWWKPARDFDEENSVPDEVFVSGKYSTPWPLPLQLIYRWRLSTPGPGVGGFDFQVTTDANGTQRYLYTGKVTPFHSGDWVHVAYVWDMAGIPRIGGARYGVYINGQAYPLRDAINPGTDINCTMAKPAGAHFSMGYYSADANLQLRGVVDNVKVWSYARTDFSDRDREGD